MSKEIRDVKYGRLYLLSFKKQLVKEVEQEGGAIKMIGDRYGVNRHVLTTWMNKYGSEAYKNSIRKYRSIPERNRIVSEIVLGKLTIAEAQVKYNITCRDTITLWIRKYKREQKDFHLPAVLAPDMVQTTAVVEQQGAPEDAFKAAQLKIRALEIMLDIASAEFKVNIRKKYGAKQ